MATMMNIAVERSQNANTCSGPKTCVSPVSASAPGISRMKLGETSPGAAARPSGASLALLRGAGPELALRAGRRAHGGLAAPPPSSAPATTAAAVAPGGESHDGRGHPLLVGLATRLLAGFGGSGAM
jgi:hypothetical protein